MNADLLRRARRLYMRGYASRSIQRHNVLAWARSVHRLGDRWLLAQPVSRNHHS